MPRTFSDCRSFRIFNIAAWCKGGDGAAVMGEMWEVRGDEGAC